MSKWIQLVVVRVHDGSHDAYLYRAPRFKCEAGDTVVVNFGGERQGTVLMVWDACVDGERKKQEAMNIAKAFGAHWPLQPVLSIITAKELCFDNEDWTPEDDKEESDDPVRAD